MARFTVEQVAKEREPFGDYEYRILRGGKLVARYWHDYRGDGHRLELVGGDLEIDPVGRMVDFLEGGGPYPLTLSAAAQEHLRRALKRVMWKGSGPLKTAAKKAR